MEPTPALLPPVLLARYPFLEESAEFVRRSGPALEEILFDRAYATCRARGVGRVRRAIEESTIEPPAVGTDSEALVEILSYAVARMVVSLIDHPHAVRRYAVAESKRCSGLLEREEEPLVSEIAGRLGIRVRGLEVAATDFLRHAVTLRDSRWKLVNQKLHDGFVTVTGRQLARLCEEALRRRIERELPIEPSEEVRRAFGGEAKELRAVVEERARRFELRPLGAVDLTAIPPCMRNILAQLQAGQNAPHTARFAITSFLHNIGMDSEAIMRLFATAPDFKEALTRYQVEHITGASSGTEYTPPSCSTMQTYNICPLEERDWRCLAPRMHHPLTYYRWAVRDKAPRQAEPLPAPPTGEDPPGQGSHNNEATRLQS